MKIKSLPQSERPVEKIISQGVAVLSNAELLAVLIGSGTRSKSAIGLAEDILSSDSSGVVHLAESSAEELMAVDGIGSFKAARVLAAIELGKRIAVSPRHKKVKIRGADDIAGLFMEDMRYEKREMFKVLLLNPRGEIMYTQTISIGELTSTLVHPREVFNLAVRKSAAGIVFIHNHPSGDPSPSEEDINVTYRLQECGKLLGIKVLDHIIIGDGSFASLSSKGYIT